MSTLQDCIRRLGRELNCGSLAVGTLDCFKQGQLDFEKWGCGLLTGSMPWILERLEDHMERLGMLSFEWSPARKLHWQIGDLEGFSIRIQGMIPREGALAGFYLGRIGDSTYALFGLRINVDESEPSGKTGTLSMCGRARS